MYKLFVSSGFTLQPVGTVRLCAVIVVFNYNRVLTEAEKNMFPLSPTIALGQPKQAQPQTHPNICPGSGYKLSQHNGSNDRCAKTAADLSVLLCTKFPSMNIMIQCNNSKNTASLLRFFF